MTMTREGVPGGEEVWRDDRGSVTVTIPAPSIVLCTAKGHASADLTPAFLQAVEQRIAKGIRVHWFGDYSEMVSYDSQLRIGLSNFVNTHKANMDQLCILVRSRLVAMGVSVANLAVGGRIRAVSDPVVFKRVYSETVARVRGESLSHT